MRLSTSGLAGIALVLALAPLTPAVAGKADNTFRASIERPIDVIDPYYSGINEGLSIIGQLFWDTLIYRDPRTNEYVPLLAKSWTWKDDEPNGYLSITSKLAKALSRSEPDEEVTLKTTPQ